MTFNLMPRTGSMRNIIFLAGVCATALLAQNQPPIVWMGGGHAGPINPVVAAGDGTVWSGSPGDHTLKNWALSNLTLLKTLAVD